MAAAEEHVYNAFYLQLLQHRTEHAECSTFATGESSSVERWEKRRKVVG